MTTARGTSNRAKGNIKANVPRIDWTVREFAAAINVNYQTALGMIHTGQVGHFKAGGEYRIPNSENRAATSRDLTAEKQIDLPIDGSIHAKHTLSGAPWTLQDKPDVIVADRRLTAAAATQDSVNSVRPPSESQIAEGGVHDSAPFLPSGAPMRGHYG